MISIIITAYKEEKTIGKAIETFLNQKISEDYEIFGVCPDKETADVIKSYSKKNKHVKYLKDPHKGKPAALNLVFKKARGRILILTDGDVYSSSNSISELLSLFSDKTIGAVAGRPVSISPRNTMLGYWSCILTNIAHELRLKSFKNHSFIHCTGYLYAIRSGLVKELPENALVDDGYISHKIFDLGYKIGYAPRAEVYVKYPSNFSDWVKQKKRSTGGYNQLKDFGINHKEQRSFIWESFGFWRVLSFAKSFKELIWSFNLLFSRIYLWLLIYRDVNLNKNKLFGKHGWERIESTK